MTYFAESLNGLPTSENLDGAHIFWELVLGVTLAFPALVNEIDEVVIFKPRKSCLDLRFPIAGDLDKGFNALVNPLAVPVLLFMPHKEVFTGSTPAVTKEGGVDNEDCREWSTSIDFIKNVGGWDIVIDFGKDGWLFNRLLRGVKGTNEELTAPDNSKKARGQDKTEKDLSNIVGVAWQGGSGRAVDDIDIIGGIL